MRIKAVSFAAAAALTCFGGAAMADPAYKASDLVSRFSAQKQDLNLGASRALCIGTDTECAKAIPSAAKPAAGFDLVVNFEYNSDNLTAPAKTNLDEFAKALKDPRLDRMSFVVEGHTDAKGGDDYNLDLSTRRANSVVRYLSSRGVETAKLEPKGVGKLSPIGSDPMDPANRRVETRLRAD